MIELVCIRRFLVGKVLNLVHQFTQLVQQRLLGFSDREFFLRRHSAQGPNIPTFLQLRQELPVYSVRRPNILVLSVLSAARPRRTKCAKPKPRGAENQKVTVYAFTLTGWP